jgi:predicted lipoprotein with Yx(FWY)xxD motif
MWQVIKDYWKPVRVPIVMGGLLAFTCLVLQTNVPTASAQAVNNAVLTTKTASSIGNYLADPNGRALYTYNADTPGVSNCTGGCLAAWPAYQDKGSTTGLPTGVGTIKRSDNGEIQYTYQGLPLYYFINDSGGTVTGNGVENFRVAMPASAPQSATKSQSTQTTKPSTKLPTTGPSSISTQLLAIGLLTLASVGYQRSRHSSRVQ